VPAQRWFEKEKRKEIKRKKKAIIGYNNPTTVTREAP